mmetsp:Transcript_9347/g.24116  ORF Transcript_9347/g.24116 Transcript_9347/m.24116 type:complete len:520 (-) Transcript_9347:279-1838(-)
MAGFAMGWGSQSEAVAAQLQQMRPPPRERLGGIANAGLAPAPGREPLPGRGSRNASPVAWLPPRALAAAAAVAMPGMSAVPDTPRGERKPRELPGLRGPSQPSALAGATPRGQVGSCAASPVEAPVRNAPSGPFRAGSPGPFRAGSPGPMRGASPACIAAAQLGLGMRQSPDLRQPCLTDRPSTRGSRADQVGAGAPAAPLSARGSSKGSEQPIATSAGCRWREASPSVAGSAGVRQPERSTCSGMQSASQGSQPLTGTSQAPRPPNTSTRRPSVSSQPLQQPTVGGPQPSSQGSQQPSSSVQPSSNPQGVVVHSQQPGGRAGDTKAADADAQDSLDALLRDLVRDSEESSAPVRRVGLAPALGPSIDEPARLPDDYDSAESPIQGRSGEMWRTVVCPSSPSLISVCRPGSADSSFSLGSSACGDLDDSILGINTNGKARRLPVKKAPSYSPEWVSDTEEAKLLDDPAPRPKAVKQVRVECRPPLGLAADGGKMPSRRPRTGCRRPRPFAGTGIAAGGA